MGFRALRDDVLVKYGGFIPFAVLVHAVPILVHATAFALQGVLALFQLDLFLLRCDGSLTRGVLPLKSRRDIINGAGVFALRTAVVLQGVNFRLDDLHRLTSGLRLVDAGLRVLDRGFKLRAFCAGVVVRSLHLCKFGFGHVNDGLGFGNLRLDDGLDDLDFLALDLNFQAHRLRFVALGFCDLQGRLQLSLLKLKLRLHQGGLRLGGFVLGLNGCDGVPQGV